MITLEMTLWPYGRKTLETPLLSGRIWTASARSGVEVHRFEIRDASGGMIAEGEIDRTLFGFRSPLYLLDRILSSINIDSLPWGQIKTEWDGSPEAPSPQAPAPEPIDDVKSALLERLWKLANADPTLREAPAAGDQSFQRITALLGGTEVLQHSLESTLNAHDLLMQGLPGEALVRLITHLEVLDRSTVLEQAIGMDSGTFQQLQDTPSTKLGSEHGGRAWTFAEILARATAVLGSQEMAERWLSWPQIGLNQHRPIDLLKTAIGAKIVATFLQRLQHGVYT